MIEINLAKPQEDVRNRRNSVLAAVFIIACFTLLVGWYVYLLSRIQQSRSVESSLRGKSVELSQTRDQISHNNQRQLEINREATAIEELLRLRKKPLLVMQAITAVFPSKHRLSLTNLSQTKHQVRLSGKACGLADVAEFVSGLNDSPLFESVELQKWRTREGILYFEILCLLKGLSHADPTFSKAVS